MARYVVSRILHSVLLLLVLAVVFFATPLLGAPASLMLLPKAGEEQYQKLRHELGLSASLPLEFMRFAGNPVRGDFGDSIWQGVPALPVALDRLPKALYLAAITLLVAAPLALTLGIVWPSTRGLSPIVRSPSPCWSARLSPTIGLAWC